MARQVRPTRPRRPDRSVRVSARLAFSAAIGATVAVAIWRNRRSDALKALQQLPSPLVVPIDDHTGEVSAIGESHPAVPQLAGGRLIVPVENAGLGPAINVRATLKVISGDWASDEYASISVLAPGRRAALIFDFHESLVDFELQLTFEDSAARVHRLTARWCLEQRSYRLGR
jgi:hypothetical protein